MAVTTAAVAVAAGATVAAASAQKKGAKEAGAAFENVGVGVAKMDRFEKSMRQLLGGDRKPGGKDDRYKLLQDQSFNIVRDQMAGQLSEATRVQLGRRALATGAVGLGRGAVQDAYTGYLGLTTESQVQAGFNNYRAMFQQLAGVSQREQAMTYNMQYNQAAAQAGSIMGQANATAGMWQGLASIAGGVAGGFGGGAGGAAAGNVSTSGMAAGASGIPVSYVPRNVSQRPPGI